MTIVSAVATLKYAQYDGSNSAEIVTFMHTNWNSSVSVLSETGGVLTIGYGYLNESQLNETDWIDPNGNVVTDESFQERFIVKP
jgi:hypothetical protein